MKDYKNRIILVMAAVIMILILLIKPVLCNEPKVQHSIDSTSSKSIYSDTLIIYKDTGSTKLVPHAVYLAPKDGTIVDDKGDSIRVYKRPYNSKYVSIEVTDSIRGKLLSQRLKYTLKIPKDCVVVTNNITKHDSVVKIPKFTLYGGLDIGSTKTTFTQITPNIQINWKSKQYKVGYDILNKAIIGGVSIKLISSKK